MSFSIACADVGSISAGNFGWAICDPPAELAIAPGPTPGREVERKDADFGDERIGHDGPL